MSNIPAELKYTASHEWIKTEGDLYVIGLTDFAQSALGDIVFIELPQEGDAVTMGESFADVESVKAVSGVFSPVSGTVAAVNEALTENPALLNEAPYDAWLIKVSGAESVGELLDAAGYEAVCKAEEA
ncbi:glycine cleavage system protein GcvH [Mailhella massiliensis]|uniref:Glycine cleavage system H protein n=1 Tax=Mailhella massiliensis TaxID=1903261 RepID=A0A921DRS9_9BACT|nr:glycine cleavage system protein GcvH [Mailhella massiliensis]HJD97356.1 glycine cleavage system protein GcvH [Mailhella massiliensis]